MVFFLRLYTSIPSIPLRYTYVCRPFNKDIRLQYTGLIISNSIEKYNLDIVQRKDKRYQHSTKDGFLVDAF
jgi:hypothetical protein